MRARRLVFLGGLDLAPPRLAKALGRVDEVGSIMVLVLLLDWSYSTIAINTGAKGLAESVICNKTSGGLASFMK